MGFRTLITVAIVTLLGTAAAQEGIPAAERQFAKPQAETRKLDPRIPEHKPNPASGGSVPLHAQMPQQPAKTLDAVSPPQHPAQPLDAVSPPQAASGGSVPVHAQVPQIIPDDDRADPEIVPRPADGGEKAPPPIDDSGAEPFGMAADGSKDDNFGDGGVEDLEGNFDNFDPGEAEEPPMRSGAAPEDFHLSDEDFSIFEEVVKGLGEDFDPSHILTFSIPPGDDFCLYEDLTADELADAYATGDQVATLTGALFVSGGAGRDIFFKILNPIGRLLDNRMLSREASFVVVLDETGTYEMCFGNEMSRFSNKVVTVAFHFEKPTPPVEHLKTEDLLPIGASADKIKREMQSVSKELMFMDHRYLSLHEVQKTMGRRAVWGTLLESSVVLVVAFSQICYIKHIVEKGQPMLGYSGI